MNARNEHARVPLLYAELPDCVADPPVLSADADAAHPGDFVRKPGNQFEGAPPSRGVVLRCVRSLRIVFSSC